MIAYSSNCLIGMGWLASVAEGDSMTNVTLLDCNREALRWKSTVTDVCIHIFYMWNMIQSKDTSAVSIIASYNIDLIQCSHYTTLLCKYIDVYLMHFTWTLRHVQHL